MPKTPSQALLTAGGHTGELTVHDVSRFDPGDVRNGLLAPIRLLHDHAACVGFRIEFRRPAASQYTDLGFQLVLGDGAAHPDSPEKLVSGVVSSVEHLFAKPVVMPKTSAWQIKSRIIEVEDGYTPPGDLQIVYLLSKHSGPIPQKGWVPYSAVSGIGFDAIGDNFVVS